MREFVEEQDQTDFNAGIATLMRIDMIKKAMANATFDHDYKKKYNSLVAYYMELVSIMKTDDDKEQLKKLKDVTLEYYKYMELKKLKKMPPASVWQSFLDWEIELRNKEQKYGMNMPKKQDPRYALASR